MRTVMAVVVLFAVGCAATPQMTPEQRRTQIAERLRQEKRACADGMYPEHLDDIALETARQADRDEAGAHVIAANMQRSAALVRGERPPPVAVPGLQGIGRHEQQIMNDRTDFTARCRAWREDPSPVP